MTYRLNYNGTLKQRLISFVSLDDLDNPNGCWNWTGNKNEDGYGQISKDKKTRRAHVISYELFVEPISEGLVVTHTCNNPACINPRHLIAKTQLENMQQASVEGSWNVKGELNNNSKLTEEQVREIKFGTERGVDLAERFGISKQNVSDIRKGRSWKHIHWDVY